MGENWNPGNEPAGKKTVSAHLAGARYPGNLEENEESKSGSSSTFILGSLTIALLCLCVLLFPLLVGNGDLQQNEKQLVQAQMHQIVDKHIAEQTPIAMKMNLLENGGYVPPVVVSASAQSGPDKIIESEYTKYKELNQARELRWHGKTDEAIRLLESYILQHPKLAVARIELAYCYLKSDQVRKARLAGIAGLMAHPTVQEKEILWQIIGRCPKG